MLDDPSIDALVIAAPDHWHAPATLMALQAGKHVYVEKPGSHCGAESDALARALGASPLVAQLGSQRRSWPVMQDMAERLRGGAIGSVRHVRAWYANKRKPIGRTKATPVPEWLDWDLWQGPAPRSPYRNPWVHYEWHWFWRWGTGELGNNGVHFLDLVRWSLGLRFPERVTSGGSVAFFPE